LTGNEVVDRPRWRRRISINRFALAAIVDVTRRARPAPGGQTRSTLMALDGCGGADDHLSGGSSVGGRFDPRRRTPTEE
jgi:hypothetical protein